MKKITFLVIDKHTGQGGLENVLINVTQGLQTLDIDTNVLMLYPPKDISFSGRFTKIKIMPPIADNVLKKLPHFIAYPIWKVFFKKKAFSFLEKNLNIAQPNAIVVLNISKNLLRISSFLKSYQSKHPEVPIISWPHSSLTTINNKELNKLKRISSLFHSYLAISNGLKKELESKLNAKKIELVYNPISPANTIPRNHKNFIFIGAINSPGKQVKELLTVFSKITGNWSLTLIGAPNNCSIDDLEIVQYAKSIGIYEKLKIYQWQKSPWSLIDQAGVLLLNSQYEGFGLVLAEAMMRGIPCLSSNCPVGPKDIIIEGINGWLYEPNDYIRCQTIIQKIINKEIKLPSQISIQNSVLKFKTENVVNQFKEKILLAIEDSSISNTI